MSSRAHRAERLRGAGAASGGETGSVLTKPRILRARMPSPTLYLRRAATAGAFGSGLFLLACALPVIGLFGRQQSADVALYQRYGEQLLAGRIPYRDYYVEYPPASLVAFAAPALGPAEHYTVIFKALMVLCGCAAIACLAIVLARIGAGPLRLYGATAFAGLAPLALGEVVLDRYDLWPSALTAGALAGVALGHSRLPYGLLGLGAAAKVYPLVLLPLLAVRTRRVAGRSALKRGLAAFAATTLVVVLPFALLGPGGVRFSAKVQLVRPLQVESLGGSLAFAADRLGLTDVSVSSEYGSHNVHGAGVRAITLLVTLLLIASLSAVWLTFARGEPTLARLAGASIAVVAAFVAFGKVLSPQYLIWLIPLVPLALESVWLPAAALLLAALALTHVWFPEHYSDVVALDDIAWLVLARNAVLVALFSLLLVSLARRRA